MNEKSGQRNSTKIVSENLRPYNKYAVAKFRNELTDVIYPNFAKSGHQYSQVLLNIIISDANQEKQATLDLDGEEVMKAVNFKSTKHMSLSKALKTLFDDMQTTIDLTTGQAWTKIYFFSEVDYNQKTRRLRIELNTKVIPLLTNLERNYNKTLTYDLASLTGNYVATQLYLLLRQYRQIGRTKKLSMKDVIARFQVPKSYQKKPTYIESRVFKKAIDLLEKKHLFEDIKACPITNPKEIGKSRTGNRGRQKILGYYFTFKTQYDSLEVAPNSDNLIEQQIKSNQEWVDNLRKSLIKLETEISDMSRDLDLPEQEKPMPHFENINIRNMDLSKFDVGSELFKKSSYAQKLLETIEKLQDQKDRLKQELETQKNAQELNNDAIKNSDDESPSW